MPMYNSLEYSDNYSKPPRHLWQYCRDKLALDDNGAIVDFTVASSITDSFKIKEKLTSKTGNYGRKNVDIMVPLKYLSNFWENS